MSGPVMLKDTYRSLFHFSPQKNWINDPNGLVYYEGEYHLFYQYHPESTVWGPMHWGHAVSTDLLNWDELPIALYPDELGAIFSGSALIDWHDTAGFGKEAMIAIFTHSTKSIQQQSIAYSNDRGRTWTKYKGNPVVTPPDEKIQKDFRDPKVFWYSAKNEAHWVMAVAASTDYKILFYTSEDLKTWQPSGEFGLQGATDGIWETPDVFALELSGKRHWVLTVGVGDGAPAGGSGQQYFIGEFDGQTFRNANTPELILWADFGADFYAGQSWSNLPARRLWIGWMNNWQYANEIPTGEFRGAMNLPRELSLSQTPEGIRLIQKPVKEVESLRTESWSWQNEVINEGSNILQGIRAEAFELFLEVTVNQDTSNFGLVLRRSTKARTTFGYNPKTKQLFFDRSQSGLTDFGDTYPQSHQAPLEANENGRITIRTVVDRASIEIFANDGLVIMSEQFFAPEDALGLEFFVEGKNIKVHELSLWKLAH